MIEKSNIKKFLKSTVKYVQGIDSDIGNVGQLFLQYIDNDNKACHRFIVVLENIKKCLMKDLKFFLDSDPAAESEEEIILAYPGFLAITYYRIANALFHLKYTIIARIITEIAHSRTGIDIHPGASICSPFFIDHGTGIVIGETSIIKKNVKIYQGVTLGAKSLKKGAKLKGIKRHPTIGNRVTIYACASILGDITIGDDSTIGANVFLLEDIPENTLVTVSKPELIKRDNR